MKFKQWLNEIAFSPNSQYFQPPQPQQPLQPQPQPQQSEICFEFMSGSTGSSWEDAWPSVKGEMIQKITSGNYEDSWDCPGGNNNPVDEPQDGSEIIQQGFTQGQDIDAGLGGLERPEYDIGVPLNPMGKELFHVFSVIGYGRGSEEKCLQMAKQGAIAKVRANKPDTFHASEIPDDNGGEEWS